MDLSSFKTLESRGFEQSTSSGKFKITFAPKFHPQAKYNAGLLSCFRFVDKSKLAEDPENFFQILEFFFFFFFIHNLVNFDCNFFFFFSESINVNRKLKLFE